MPKGFSNRRLEQRTAERDRIWRVSQDMLGVANGRGVWNHVNPAWTRILGWDSEGEPLGWTTEWLEHPEDREGTSAKIARLAEGVTSLTFANRLRARTDPIELFPGR